MLPFRLQRWWDQAGLPALPEEGRAPCSACPQCPEGGPGEGRPSALATFDPRSKCCTYLPLLRNFQVGAILAEPEATSVLGRDTVEARIDAWRAVSPLGLLWPEEYSRAYAEDGERDFGRRQELRCPHYIEQDGLCGVWRHRNATCSTWFCRYERGEVGRNLWRAVRELLDVVEDVLMWWALEAVGVDAELRARLASGDAALRLERGPVDEEARRQAWGGWVGRERALYLACHEAVEGLGWADIRRVGGARLAARLDEVQDALADHGNLRLPPFLGPGQVSRAHEDERSRWFHGYKAYDPVEVPRAAWDRVVAGGVLPTEELRRRLAEAMGAPVDDQLLRTWVDRGILRAALP